MDTQTQGALACRHAALRLVTRQTTAFIDITEHLQQFVSGTDIQFGTLCVQTRHTTTAVLVNEYEARLLTDFDTLLRRIAPSSDAYAHDDLELRPDVAADEPRNGHAHCRAAVLPPSVTLNIVGGRLALGRWQRVLFVELDGPRERELSALVMGAAL
jgi:secondary thiamine-phosphate synthase enzyme